MSKELKLFELFAGIGAPRQALKQLGVNVQSLGYSDIMNHAINGYCELYNESPDDNWGDITNIEKLPEDIDILFHGSPCQDFSTVGLQKGGNENSGTRSSLMYETLRLVAQSKPKVVIWENVLGVKTQKHIHNFDSYLSRLKELNYTNFETELNSIDFGVPQNRPRLFVVSIRNDMLDVCDFKWKTIKKQNYDLTKFIDFDNMTNNVAPSYKKIINQLEEENSVLNQPIILTCQSENFRKGKVKFSLDKVNCCTCRKDDFMKYKNGKYDYLTGQEKLKLQGFPDIKCLGDNAKHIVAGNSINVEVLKYLFSCFSPKFIEMNEDKRYKEEYKQTLLFD